MGKLTPITTRARPGITAPAPLTKDHLVQDFSCGKPALDEWLRHRALKAESRSARTYVCCVGNEVVAYYCFASGSVRLDELPKGMRRNMPTVAPVTLLGRLAVDKRYKGLKIGSGLLKDALARALYASKVIGSRAVMVHAIDDEAVGFYAAYGFQPFPDGSRTMFIAMETIAQL